MRQWEHTDDIRDREALEGDICDPMDAKDHGENLGSEDKEGQSGGATPKGQCRLGRPYDSWRAPTP